MSTSIIAPKPKKTKAACPNCWIYTPKAFDPSKYPGPIKQHPDAARWMLNCIYFRNIVLNLDDQEYVNLHSDLLAKVMGHVKYVRPVRLALEAHGFIECDNKYIEGCKSHGFRLGSQLSHAEFHRYHAVGKRFAKRIEVFKTHVTSQNGFYLPSHYHLERWLSKVELDPLYPEALSSIVLDKKRIRATHQAENILTGYIHRIVCPYGRFHSNFSGLCRELRPYLRINGCPLVEVDIVNSQPYFLSMLLLEQSLSQNGKCSSNLSNLWFENLEQSCLQKDTERKKEQREKNKEPYDLHLSTFKTIPKEETIREDLLRMVDKTTSGTFYESFQSLRQTDRDRLKKRLFAFMYGDTRIMDLSAISPEFRNLYPSVFKTIKELKQDKGHKWIGQELQRRESEIVIDHVISELMKIDKEIPIITIHDSILTTPEHLETVKLVLGQCLRQRNHYTPKLKTKSLSS